MEFLNAGWVGTLIGVVFSIYFYRKSLRIPNPRVSIKSDHVLTWSSKDELPNGVEIRVHDELVPRIARSVIRIWNAGSGCLTKEHFSDHDPIRFALQSEGKFLKAILVKESNPAIKCEINILEDNPSEVSLKLDFLNQDEGVVIGLIHTDVNAAPLIKGTLKGYSLKITEEIIRKKQHGYRKWLVPLVKVWIPIALGLMMIGFGMMGESQWKTINDWLLPSHYPNSSFAYAYRFFAYFVGSSYIYFGAHYFWRNRRTYPKSLLISKDLDN